MRLPRNNHLLGNARALRREMTKEERRLWYDFLRGYVPRFTRQKILGNRILDFYCDAAALAIELDGSQHYTPEGKQLDALRTEEFSPYGVQVLRFSNLDVIQNFEGVCLCIERTVKERTPGRSRLK